MEDGLFGDFYFKAAVLLRESLFLNSILLNMEVAYNLTAKDLKIIETIDNRLMRSIFKAYSGTPVSIMFLELKCIPIKFILIEAENNIFTLSTMSRREKTFVQFFHDSSQ